MNNFAIANRVAGRPADALPLLREVLDKRRRQQLAQPLDIAKPLASLGGILIVKSRGRHAHFFHIWSLEIHGCPSWPLRDKSGTPVALKTQAIAGSRVDVMDPCATFSGNLA